MVKKSYFALRKLRLRTSTLAVASCLALSGLPLAADAAGLGKVSVFSELGQPLRAEIELSATREELSGMRAQLASADAFRQAGLDLPTTLLGIKFAIDKRPNGVSVIKLTSDRPINDPFVDMLLEINWPAGRLVREYTFLLDPPEVAAKAAAPVAPALTRPVEARPAASAEPRPAPKAERAPPRAAEPAARAAGTGEHEVKRGETLRKIANETKPEGVSLEQMLVGLFRANQEAFDGGNMNRLKAGKILTVPEKGAVEAVSEAEAKKIVVAQSSDWNAYRRKLAGVAAQAPVSADAGKQQAAGRITARVEDKAAPAEAPKDQVRVSTSGAAGAKGAAAAKPSEEDTVAREKALREANERLASLEKNVAELQKLVDMKNQSLAELQKQAAGKAPSKAPDAVAAAPALVPPPPAPEVAKPAEPALAPPAAPEKADEPAATKSDEVKPEAAPEPAPAPAEMPKPKPKVVIPPPEPEPEPSFVEELLGNPSLLGGVGGILALLAGYVVYKRRRAPAGEAPIVGASTLSQQSSLTANSVFRSTGGQSVDTSHTPAQTDFSQAGPGSIDTDEVDPVAEADVYMAYGRDAQAEEILLEAKQKDPKRLAIHLKLLEIYANRKSLKQFEELATELYSETGGAGGDWEKAAAMGLKLDPQNPLYGISGQAAAAPAEPFDPDATLVVPAQSAKSSLSDSLAPLAATAVAGAALGESLREAAEREPAAETAHSNELESLDFDLGIDSADSADSADLAPELTSDSASGVATPPASAVGASEAAEAAIPPEADMGSEVLDFDLGAPELPAGPSSLESVESVEGALGEEVAALDFSLPEISIDALPAAETPVASEVLDFDLGSETEPFVAEAPPAEPALEPLADATAFAGIEDDALDFDVKLTDSTILGQPMQAPSFDISALSLDLAETPPADPFAPATAESDLEHADTVVNTGFAAEQVDTLVNPDFSVEQAETVVNPQFGMTSEAAPDFQIAASEEVATKLDLAKAYEEMGDLEGARELLQEVLGEGDATQREKAQAILAKIGE